MLSLLCKRFCRQGWASFDFRDEEHAARLGKLLESPEFELYELTAKNAEMFDEVVSKQTTLLETEIIDLANDADRLANEIAKLSTQRQPSEKIPT